MPKDKFTVALSDKEIAVLDQITHKGKGNSALVIMHANVLLNTNDNNPRRMTDREVAEQFSISKTTVNNIRMAYANDGLDAALHRKTQITASMISKITGEFEAQVIAAALSPPPKGKARWTLRLLAEHCVENKYIVTISHTAIGDMLNTNQVKPHINAYWASQKKMTRRMSPAWRMSLAFTGALMTHCAQLFAWTRSQSSFWRTRGKD